MWPSPAPGTRTPVAYNFRTIFRPNGRHVVYLGSCPGTVLAIERGLSVILSGDIGRIRSPGKGRRPIEKTASEREGHGRRDHTAGGRDGARFAVDTRTTLLDALRERLGITSPKKGCDHGQCGACTVLLDGRRANSCLALAVAHEGRRSSPPKGSPADEDLHPMQRAFIEHDALPVRLLHAGPDRLGGGDAARRPRRAGRAP